MTSTKDLLETMRLRNGDIDVEPVELLDKQPKPESQSEPEEVPKTQEPPEAPKKPEPGHLDPYEPTRPAKEPEILSGPFEPNDDKLPRKEPEILAPNMEPLPQSFSNVEPPSRIAAIREPGAGREAIRGLIEAGCDFLKNFFEVAFVYVDKAHPQASKLLLTRTGSIEIPRLKAKTFQVRTIRGSIEKVSAKMDGSYETTLNIRPDQDCFILDKFSEEGGVLEFADPIIYPASSLFTGDPIGSYKSHRLDILVKQISGFEHEPAKSYLAPEKEALNSGSWALSVNSPNVRLNESVISEWLLEDVKIVSVIDSDSFSFGTTSPQDLSLHLTIKSVSHRTYNGSGAAF
jgi:hypothetical protein